MVMKAKTKKEIVERWVGFLRFMWTSLQRTLPILATRVCDFAQRKPNHSPDFPLGLGRFRHFSHQQGANYSVHQPIHLPLAE